MGLTAPGLAIGGASWLVLVITPGVVAFTKRDRQALGLCLAQLVAVGLFVILRASADQWGVPVSVRWPAMLDRGLGLGELPTLRLQRWLYVPGRVTWLERLTALAYGAHGAAPWALALPLLVWRRDRFAPFMVAMIGLLAVALAVHVLLPTAPPWMGATGVSRVLADVSRSIDPAAYEAGLKMNGNDVAAMPSVHMGVAWLIVLATWREGSRWRVCGLAYALAVAWAIVYGGEHYVVDALAGMLVAWGCWRLARKVLLWRA